MKRFTRVYVAADFSKNSDRNRGRRISLKVWAYQIVPERQLKIGDVCWPTGKGDRWTVERFLGYQKIGCGVRQTNKKASWLDSQCAPTAPMAHRGGW